ncbi:MAG: bifunctional DNA-formamidopyrimidine glycosylase/DNA-(apurinic or apyrimidinic site) lyase [Rhodobacteraceae bacterium]|nr:bifunctional DNA-formamidopyrimidine glycosylase/DNA-(apurinic or apyrimidinic site) lyase [Paracoccaceae bacterium]
MPELPEVETVRRGLAPVLEGRCILAAEARRADLRAPLPDRLGERLAGARVTGLGRRAKYLLAGLDRGETLLIHLGMTGRILVAGAVLGDYHHRHAAPGRHDHLVLDLEGGQRVTFNDPRRFGLLDLWPSATLAAHPLLAALGPEPLGNAFGADELARALAGRRTPVKAALLDQRVVAGLGNIYAAEALHRAGIAPWRPAGRIAPRRIAALAAAIRAVLLEAIAAGGSSLRDFRHADGELGHFQHAFRVYDREGRPCPTPGCTGTIRRTLQGGRSSFHCPRCQR